MSLSVCTIVKNEEKHLKEYVDSISSFADEIILVDNQSSDGTYELAKKLGCKVFKSDVEFDEARNTYIQHASCDWILTLDVDERILPQYYDQIKNSLTEMPNSSSVVACPRNDYFGNGHWSMWILPRYLRNRKELYYHGKAHGSITRSVVSSGSSLGYIPCPMEHLDGIINTEKDNYRKRIRNIDIISRQIKENPGRSSLYAFLGHEYAAINEYGRARELCLKGIQLDSDHHTRSAFILSAIEAQFKDYESSIFYADMQIEHSTSIISSGNARSERAKREIGTAKMIKARSLIKMGRLAEAVEECLHIIEIAPEFVPPYINLFFIDQNQYSDYIRMAIKKNRMMLEKSIYIPIPRYTLNEMQDTIAFDYNYEYINKIAAEAK